MSIPTLIDSHCHLQHRRFAEEQPPLSPVQLMDEAAKAGVGHLITIACRRAEWQPALELAASHPGRLSVAVGIHPQDVAEEALATVEELEQAAHNRHVVALGETGLDYYYENSPRSLQQQSFHTHLNAAKNLNLPAVIHTRDAEADTIAILHEHKGAPFVLHCFSGSAWLAEEALGLGGYISFSGILTFKNSQSLRDIAATLPHDRVLVETDAPYLAPHPHRSKRNQPALLPHTAACLAEVWQTSPAEAAQITARNTRRLFTRLTLS